MNSKFANGFIKWQLFSTLNSGHHQVIVRIVRFISHFWKYEPLFWWHFELCCPHSVHFGNLCSLFVQTICEKLDCDFYFPVAQHASGPGPPDYRGITITLRHSTFGRTPLDQWSARRKYLYVTTHITRKRQTYMPPARFELRVPASERPHTHVLDRVATGTGNWGLNLA
jgi:hypothetical protein